MKSTICYIVLTSEKDAPRRDKLQNTWLKDKPHVFMSDSQNLERNIVMVSNRNDSIGQEEKLVNGTIVIRNNWQFFQNFDWLFFCQDDTFVFEKNLRKILPYLSPTSIYANVSKESPEKTSISSGVFVNTRFFLSLGNFQNFGLGSCDETFSKNVKSFGIGLTDLEGFNRDNPNQLGHDDNTAIDQITYSSIWEHVDIDRLCQLDSQISEG